MSPIITTRMGCSVITSVKETTCTRVLWQRCTDCELADEQCTSSGVWQCSVTCIYDDAWSHACLTPVVWICQATSR